MTQVFFSPSTKYCSAIDVVRPDGRGMYGGKTLDECRLQYPDVQIVDEDLAIEHDRNRRITQPKEITKEQFWYWLECLPPCKWRRRQDAESFHVSERITYDIVTWCVRIGESYYTFDDTDKMTSDDAINKVAATLTKETTHE